MKIIKDAKVKEIIIKNQKITNVIKDELAKTNSLAEIVKIYDKNCNNYVNGKMSLINWITTINLVNQELKCFPLDIDKPIYIDENNKGCYCLNTNMITNGNLKQPLKEFIQTFDNGSIKINVDKLNKQNKKHQANVNNNKDVPVLTNELDNTKFGE